MTEAFRGGLTVSLHDGGDPGALLAIEEVNDLGGLGLTGGTIEASHHGSVIREFIASLREGNDLTVICNKVNTANSAQLNFMAACDANATRQVEVALSDGTVTETYQFSVLCLHWNLQPAWDDKNSIEFATKINTLIGRTST